MNSHPNEQEIHQQYYTQIREKLENDAFARYLGIELIEVGQGKAVAKLSINDNMVNAHGTTHGAVIFAIADFVFAVASNSYGKTSVALSMNIGFLAASITGDTLIATAEEEKKGNRTGWYRIRVDNGRETVAILDALAYRKNEYFVPLEKVE